jgi:hypothetical protein
MAKLSGFQPLGLSWGQQDDVDDPGFVSSFQRGLGQSVQGVGQIAEDLGWEDNFIKNYGDEVVRRNPAGVNSLEDIADNPWLAFKEATGNAASFLVPGTIVGKAGKAYGLGRAGMLAAQSGVAAVPSYGGIREQQIAQGYDSPTDMLVAGAGAATVGVIENLMGAQRLPFVRKLLGLEEASETTIKEVIKSLGQTELRTLGKTVFTILFAGFGA